MPKIFKNMQLVFENLEKVKFFRATNEYLTLRNCFLDGDFKQK